jgi:hypothetical protein
LTSLFNSVLFKKTLHIKINKKSNRCEIIVTKEELAELYKGKRIHGVTVKHRLLVSLQFVPKKTAELFKLLLDFKGIPIYSGRHAVMYEGEERCVIFFSKALLSDGVTHVREIVKKISYEKQIILKTK